MPPRGYLLWWAMHPDSAVLTRDTPRPARVRSFADNGPVSATDSPSSRASYYEQPIFLASH
ncbi:MAG TPA: hypothetical protein VK356_00655, partial [Thermomicrobiales bacterium]|nr:hypothetical protein [Thermomicrobiales bacterium]